MAIDYTWTFNPLEFEDNGDLPKSVSVVHWQCSGTDGTHSARSIGTEAMSDPDPDSFTAWDDLTPEIVKGWLPPAVISAAEANIAASIARMVEEAAANKGTGVPWD